MAKREGRIIVLAERVADVVVVTPGTLYRARGVKGRELLIASDLDELDRVGLLEAVMPCFAIAPVVPDSGDAS